MQENILRMELPLPFNETIKKAAKYFSDTGYIIISKINLSSLEKLNPNKFPKKCFMLNIFNPSLASKTLKDKNSNILYFLSNVLICELDSEWTQITVEDPVKAVSNHNEDTNLLYVAGKAQARLAAALLNLLKEAYFSGHNTTPTTPARV